MAGSTISFTPLGGGAIYSIADINQLFTDLAAVINAKLDRETAETLTSELDLNQQAIINLAEGVAATDAITVGQAKTALGVE